MPPTVILIRHAQALHNETLNYELPDPNLTALGRSQCVQLRDHLQRQLPLSKQVELILVSPMRRTLSTAVTSLSWLIENGVKLELDPDWQENADKPCDTGSPISTLQSEFPDMDFSSVDRLYPDKTTRLPDGAENPYAYSRTAVLARGQRCLRKLHDRPEKVVAVVTHSAFLRLGISQCRFANADYRIFNFAERTGDGDIKLVEWKQTEKSGGGMGRSPRERWVLRDSDFPPEA